MCKICVSCPEDMTLDTSIFRLSSTIGRRAFSYLGPRLWNGLPKELRIATELGAFKAYLKAYLYDNFQTYCHSVNPYTTFALSQ